MPEMTLPSSFPAVGLQQVRDRALQIQLQVRPELALGEDRAS